MSGGREGRGGGGADDGGRPWLPPGRHVWLPGRGRTFVRELRRAARGPDASCCSTGGRPPPTSTGGPATGRSPSTSTSSPSTTAATGGACARPRPFRLEQCADDVAALASSSGFERIVPVGYSMGGPIAQLVWRRHPELVDGLVLCATSATFTGTVRERAAVRPGHRHRRGGRRRPARSGLTSVALGRWTDWRQPPRRRVVGLRGGRPPRLDADRRGRAGDGALRLAALDRRRRRADRGRRHRRRRASCRRVASWTSPSASRAATVGGAPADTPSARRRRRASCRRCSPPAAACRRRRPMAPTMAGSPPPEPAAYARRVVARPCPSPTRGSCVERRRRRHHARHRAARAPAAALQRLARARARRRPRRRHVARAAAAAPPRRARPRPRPAGRRHPRPQRPHRRDARVRRTGRSTPPRPTSWPAGRGHARHRPTTAPTVLGPYRDAGYDVPRPARRRRARRAGWPRPTLDPCRGAGDPPARRRRRRRPRRPGLRGAPPARPLPRQHRPVGGRDRRAVLRRRRLRRTAARRARRLRHRRLRRDDAPAARAAGDAWSTPATSRASAATGSSSSATPTSPLAPDRPSRAMLERHGSRGVRRTRSDGGADGRPPRRRRPPGHRLQPHPVEGRRSGSAQHDNAVGADARPTPPTAPSS